MTRVREPVHMTTQVLDLNSKVTTLSRILRNNQCCPSCHNVGLTTQFKGLVTLENSCTKYTQALPLACPSALTFACSTPALVNEQHNWFAPGKNHDEVTCTELQKWASLHMYAQMKEIYKSEQITKPNFYTCVTENMHTESVQFAC